MPRTYVDRGGTFTDVVYVEDDGTVDVRKVPSDRAVVGDLARGALTFGTTVATNALLERRVVPTLLLVTEGFADLPLVGDMRRPSLFDPETPRPAPLCERVIEVRGRIAADGTELEPLEIPVIDLTGVEAVAVVLLNSHRNPAHELAVAERLTGVHVTLGHRIAPETGYLARIETALVDAAVTPILRRAVAADRIPADALAMRSDGTLAPVEALRAPDAVLSGPAGGVVAVAAVAAQGGFERAVGLDMGGTSTDVCRVERGDLPFRETDALVAGVRVRRPMLEIETIAAGGGSVLWNDGVRLGVGPSSAGADPGPQCYGRGGPPTLTDAALAAGLVDPLAFDPPLDAAAVRLPGKADEFLDLAREEMAAAIRRLAARRGVDLGDHALVAFGGAAGQHAAHVAERLGIEVVLVHPFAAVLSAVGQALSRRAEHAVKALWVGLDDWAAVEAAWSELASGLPPWPEVRRTVDLRYRGADHTLEIEAATVEEARRAFGEEYFRRYGYLRDAPVEVVNARVRALGPAPEPLRIDADPWSIGEGVVSGPALITSPTTSVHVPPGWRARRAHGLLRLEHVDRRPRPEPTVRTPHRVATWASRFASIAEQAGTVLERIARSVNMRERLDFSCAVFDGAGRLVANAPHIPVHLGAMGATVRDLLREVPDPEPGQAWVSNDPAAGGSHLPDLTVVSAVHHEGCRWFVACRGHHVDVGGSTPGSMPPRSARIDEEGFVVRNLPLLEGGRLRPLELPGCRDPDTVRADLEAQIASNTHAARLLVELGPAAVTDAWMAHLQDVAAELVDRVIDTLPARTEVVRDRLDGVPLALWLERRDEGLVVHLEGTGGPHPGNLNAPPAVVRAAVLFALRVLVGRPFPLNEGVLRRVRIQAPEPSIVAPPPGAAVAGGNVETSQRLVDLVLRAAGHMAASQGTMNNLTLGGQGWSFYETLGGGAGASPRGPGLSGLQVHMTNTRATDPEVLEARLPLRVRRFGLRRGSGGAGTHRGGDGLVRELELTAPGTAALLATRRDEGAPGLGAGGTGAPGRDAIRVDGAWQPWDGTPRRLAPGDRVRVESPGGGGWTAERPAAPNPASSDRAGSRDPR